MKGKLIRVCVVANDAAETMRDFNDLFGVEFYGPFDDEHVKLKVALPRSGGMEVSSPTAADDPIGFRSIWPLTARVSRALLCAWITSRRLWTS